MVKRFSIRAAIVAFVIVLVGSLVSIAWAGIVDNPPMARFTAAVAIGHVFTAPYLAVEFVLEHFGVFNVFQSFISMILISSVIWACLVGVVWPLFHRHNPPTI
jgi:hypothetical protein